MLWVLLRRGMRRVRPAWRRGRGNDVMLREVGSLPCGVAD